MPAPFANKPLALAAAVACVAAATPAVPFARAFDTTHAPRTFHATVLFRSGGAVHRMELWRDGETRLRRDTDGKLTTIATHRAGDPAYRLDLYDHARRIHNVVDRDSLYRVGRFTDWVDLAHGLKRPVGAASVTPLAAVRAPVAPVGACDWYAMGEAARRVSICWSRADAFPLLILDAAGKPVWRVVGRGHAAIAPARFRVAAPDYVLNDAASDISGD